MTINELQKRKEELGYSYETIAMLSGVSLNAVENLFTDDKVLDITYEEKLAIESVLKVPEDNFIREKENSYLAKMQGEFTLEDYYAIPDDKRVEMIDGVIYNMAAPSYEHQKFVIEIAYSFKEYIKQNKGHCEVLISPIDVQLDCDDRTMVQPDILIICDKNKINKRCILGAFGFCFLISSIRSLSITISPQLSVRYTILLAFSISAFKEAYSFSST